MDPLLYLLFVVLFFLSAFFSGSELALMWLPNHKIQTMVKNGQFWARILRDIKSNNDRLLITILIGNNLVNTSTSVLAGQIAASLAWTGDAKATVLWIATAIITLLLLIFWEIIPKSIATKNAEKLALIVAIPLKFLMIVWYPIIIILEVFIKIFTWKWASNLVTEEDIETYIDLWKDSWAINENKFNILRKALYFSDTLVEEIMVPRVRVDAISDDKTIEEAYNFYMEHTHSRIPVYKDRIDNIVWILTIRDILREIKKWNGQKKLANFHFKKFIKSPINQPIEVLFETFKKYRQHMAIIIDEYGWVAWITTIEDVIEEIFWEIHDETDYETDEIIEKEQWVFVIDSSILMDNIVDEFDLDLSNIWLDEKEFWTETVSYMITHQLERFPVQWEQVSFCVYDEDGQKIDKKLYFTVLDIEQETLWKIQVELKDFVEENEE